VIKRILSILLYSVVVKKRLALKMCNPFILGCGSEPGDKFHGNAFLQSDYSEFVLSEG